MGPLRGSLRWAAGGEMGADVVVVNEGARRQLRRAGRRRTHVRKVRLTPEQDAAIVARAAERGVTVPRLLVESALAGGADAAATRSELAGALIRLTGLLGHAGNNVNQLAKVANASGELPAAVPAALDALTAATGQIEAFLVTIGARA